MERRMYRAIEAAMDRPRPSSTECMVATQKATFHTKKSPLSTCRATLPVDFRFGCAVKDGGYSPGELGTTLSGNQHKYPQAGVLILLWAAQLPKKM